METQNNNNIENIVLVVKINIKLSFKFTATNMSRQIYVDDYAFVI